MAANDPSQVSENGQSSKQMSDDAEAAEKYVNHRKFYSVSSDQNEKLDLEKGLKQTESNEVEESSADHMSRGAEYKDDDEDQNGHCRVCHLVFDAGFATNETMELGCHCKEDLAVAHRDCAEAWFKIKGNRICEICGATAQNIVGAEDTGFMDQWNDAEASTATETHTRCWQSLSLCNFFLACMVVTFILLWLFRVTIS
ncbi:hypothetical protein KP509_16G080400 [Ceratopteris richardii]|nr:hypothetical protein KP509_16G080400 [Ceratopteris richardii]